MCLIRFLEAADNKAKIWVVRLLTSLLQSACPPKVSKKPLSSGKDHRDGKTPVVDFAS